MITSKAVQDTICDCFCSEGTTLEQAMKMMESGECKRIEGLTRTYALRADKLKEHEHSIRELLSEMHDEFFADKGGGWSFLNLCIDRNGNQWGGYRDAESLVILGIGIGCVEYMTKDRKMWHTLPGGMPYMTINMSKAMES